MGNTTKIQIDKIPTTFGVGVNGIDLITAAACQYCPTLM